MGLLVLTVRFKIIHLNYYQGMVINLLHHTGLMLVTQELELFTIVRPMILISVLEQPVK